MMMHKIFQLTKSDTMWDLTFAANPSMVEVVLLVLSSCMVYLWDFCISIW